MRHLSEHPAAAKANVEGSTPDRAPATQQPGIWGLAQRVIDEAFKIPPPNQFTPVIVSLAQAIQRAAAIGAPTPHPASAAGGAFDDVRVPVVVDGRTEEEWCHEACRIGAYDYVEVVEGLKGRWIRTFTGDRTPDYGEVATFDTVQARRKKSLAKAEESLLALRRQLSGSSDLPASEG